MFSLSNTSSITCIYYHIFQILVTSLELVYWYYYQCICMYNYCLQDDHTTSSCPLNQPVMPWFQDVPAWPATGMRSQAQSRSSICRQLLNNMMV